MVAASSSFDDEGIVCRVYTSARRHPYFIGKVGGWSLPTGPITPTQLGCWIGSFAALSSTRALWGALFPGIATLVVLVAAPTALAWCVRHVRAEGRSPLRFAAGVVAARFAPATGTSDGRPVRAPRRRLVRAQQLFVAESLGGVAPAPPAPPLP